MHLDSHRGGVDAPQAPAAWWKTTGGRYGLALGMVALAIALRLALSPLLGEGRDAFITLFVTLAVVGATAGLGPALVSLVAGAVGAWVFLFAPAFSFRVAEPHQIGSLVIFLIGGFFCALVGDIAVRARARAERGAHASRESAAALARQTRLLESITDNASTALFILDGRRHCVFMNPAAERLTGFTLGEVQARDGSLRQLIRPARSDGSHEPLGTGLIDQAFATRDQVKGEEVFVHKDGRVYPVEFTASPILDDTATPAGAVIEVRDITQRKQTEQALIRERQRLDIALRADSLGVYEWRVGEQRVWWSPEAYPLFGVDPATFSPTVESFNALVHPDDRAELWRKSAESIDRGELFEHEYRIVRPDGQVRWIYNRSRVSSDDGVKLVTGMVADITDRNRAEQAVRESESRFRLMADGLPFIIWVHDADGKLVLINRTYCEYYGCQPESVYGEAWKPLVHPDDVGAYVGSFLDSLRQQTSWTAECRVQNAKGEWRWIESHSQPRFSPEGSFLGVVGGSVDITARRTAEQSLRLSEQRIQIALEVGKGGAWDLNLLTGDNYWSDSHFTLLGYAPTADRRATEAMWKDVIVAEDLPAVLSEWERAERERDGYRAEMRLRRADDGRMIWVRAAGQFYYDDSGRAVRMRGVFFDITEQKHAEQALREALTDSQLLHRLAMAMARPGEPQELYERLMDAAVAIMKSDFASLQLLHPERGEPGGIGELELVAHRNFTPEAAAFWRWVRPDSHSACAAALRAGQRCDIADSRDDERIAGDDLRICESTGIRAVQTTPLVSRDGRVLGAISTHWRQPRDPRAVTERDWKMLDVLAQHAADLLERTCAEEALRLSEARFATALRTVTGVLWTNNPRGEMEGEQPGWAALTGQTQEQYRGHGWSAAVHPDDARPTLAAWTAFVNSGREVFEFEHRVRRHDGAYRLCTIRAAAIRRNGAVVEFVGVHTDVTEERAAQEALRESELRLRSALHAGGLGVWELDPATGAVRWDARLYEIFGLDPSTEPGKTDLLARIPAEERAIVDARLAAALAGGPDYEAEFRFSRPDGRTVWILGRGGPVGPPSRRRLVGVNKDITIYKETERLLEERLAERTKQLGEAQSHLRRSERLAAMGTLAAGIGHDLANIMLPMRLRVESLGMYDLPAAAREDLEGVASGFKYLQDLSAGLRLLTADPGSPVPAGGTHLPEWWRQAEGMLRGVLPRHVRLEATLAPVLPPVNAGKPGLTQAVFNLVQNAGEAMAGATSGTVRISARADTEERGAAGTGVVLTVADDGPGMTAEVASRCFEPYFSTKGRAISTGMGLSLVRSVVESAGGSIEVDSTLGVGTTFTLRLPAWVERGAGDGRDGGAPLTAALDGVAARQAALVRAMLPPLGVRVREADGLPDGAVALWITGGRPADELAAFIRGRTDDDGGAGSPSRVAVVFAPAPAGHAEVEAQALPPRVLYAGPSPDVATVRSYLAQAVALVRERALGRSSSTR